MKTTQALPPSSNTGGNYSPDSKTCHVDALAFSFLHPGFTHHDLPALSCLLRRFFVDFSSSVRNRGWMGYSDSADVNIGGLIAFGGESQRGRVFVSLMGVACSLCTDWSGLSAWLAETGARISRIDLAHDDLEGANYSVDHALKDYAAGAYNPIAAGNPPACKFISSGNFGERPARTLNVGKRENGKMVRVYEKGQQLSDADHPDWVRIEVELRAKDRVIPYDAIVNPAQYLAAAYPALGWISAIKTIVKTARRIAEKTLDQYTQWAQRQVGRVVHALATFHGGDFFAVIDRIKRNELPRRLLGAHTHLSPQGS
jgi:phage replication initiation protein